MPSSRIRMSRFRTDGRPVSARIPACLPRRSLPRRISQTPTLPATAAGVLLGTRHPRRRGGARTHPLEPRSPLRPAEWRADGEPLVAQDRRADRPVGLVGSQESPLTVSLSTLRADLLQIVARRDCRCRCRPARRAGARPRHARRHAAAPTDVVAVGKGSRAHGARVRRSACRRRLRRGVLVTPRRR